MYGKCSKTDLIINSGSGLVSKVMGPFSSHCSGKDKYDTLFPGIEFMRRPAFDACTSDNCHGSFPSRYSGTYSFEKKKIKIPRLL
ncbi:hypothetical protein RCL_jg8543.t1 [Rhizophagus clarus]|uniref:Uncharacterized protein n=1 Tax=Rhizophagus clarus TaxID=94130 RepID=A0A8H3QFK8_9GLOM|nr:hypothetical protein RCL_jg8543.t1 [Rhizophagus clarus]